MAQMARLGRERLPNRRPALTSTAEWNGRPLAVTIGFSDDLRALEVFTHDLHKADSERDRLAADIGVLLSRLLQHGDSLPAIARGLGRLPDGAPSSIVGAIADAALGLA